RGILPASGSPFGLHLVASKRNTMSWRSATGSDGRTSRSVPSWFFSLRFGKGMRGRSGLVLVSRLIVGFICLLILANGLKSLVGVPGLILLAGVVFDFHFDDAAIGFAFHVVRP